MSPRRYGCSTRSGGNMKRTPFLYYQKEQSAQHHLRRVSRKAWASNGRVSSTCPTGFMESRCKLTTEDEAKYGFAASCYPLVLVDYTSNYSASAASLGTWRLEIAKTIEIKHITKEARTILG